MISTLELKNFRGLEHVKFENLGRANLIIGGNNTGKTSVLEAIVMKLGAGQQITALPSTFRDNVQQDDFRNYWSCLALDQEWEGFEIRTDEGILEITPLRNDKAELIDVSDGQRTSVALVDTTQISIRGIPSRQKTTILPTKASPPQAISELYNQIAPLNPENEVNLERLLRESIEPRLRRLRYAKPRGSHHHLVYVDLGTGPMLPFTQMGQAFARTLEIYCEIFANRPKILLIDEIENGLFYEGMEDFWKGLMAVLEDQDVQLFATTHSRECMEAAQKAASAMEGDPLRFLRLDRRVDDPGKIVATTFGKEEMQTAIDFNREMR